MLPKSIVQKRDLAMKGFRKREEGKAGMWGRCSVCYRREFLSASINLLSNFRVRHHLFQPREELSYSHLKGT
jgi:hypothetical protein